MDEFSLGAPFTGMEADISRNFKLNIQEIEDTFRSISGVTDKLEHKVASVLRKHEEQFFEVYKVHMNKVKKEMEEIQLKLVQKQNEALDSENNGTLAKLVRRIKELERELVGVYSKGEDKDRAIANLKVQLKIAKQEIEYLQGRFKDGLRDSVNRKVNDNRFARSEASSLEFERHGDIEGGLFATELNSKADVKESARKYQNTSVLETKNESIVDEKSKEEDKVKSRLTSEVKKLSKANKELLKKSVEATTFHSELEEFFIACIEETKKLISVRTGHPTHKISQVEFNRQDKMNLLLLLLGSDEVISTIYNKLFKTPTDIRPSLFMLPMRHLNHSRKPSRNEYKSSERGEREGSVELRLPVIDKPPSKTQGGRLAKKKNFNFHDFL